MKLTKKLMALLLTVTVATSMMPSMALAKEGTVTASGISVSKTNFPDDNFRAYLKSMPEGRDGVFTKSEISDITQISCEGSGKKSSEKISSLKGIEYFTSLEVLFCYENELTSLDLSKNRKLSFADCSRNRLQSINVRNNSSLVNLDCRHNRLKDLDVDNNRNLMYLYCDYNDLSKLNVDKNPDLEVLWCAGNNLKNLDITKNRNLVRVYAFMNDIVYVNTSNNRYLEEIYYVPEEIKMSVRENLKFEKIPTFKEFLNEYSQYYTVRTENMTLSRSAETVSLKSGHDTGKVQFKDGSKVEYEFTFTYDKDRESGNFNAELNDLFTKVNSNTYKYATEGKHLYARPVVTDENGNKLEENTDYTVEYSDDRRVNTGKYLITVKGMGNYHGTRTINLVITPGAVSDVKVRQATYSGGYDDAYVTWDRKEGADGYQVYARRPSRTSEWSYLGRTTDRDFLEKNLYDGYKYEFKVIPYVNAEGVRYRNTENYDVVSMYTMKKMSAPSVKKYSSTRVQASWSDITGESGYQLRASREGKTTYFRTTNTSYKFSVAKGRKYSYKVRAYKNVTKNGETYRVYAPWSDISTFTLK